MYGTTDTTCGNDKCGGACVACDPPRPCTRGCGRKSRSAEGLCVQCRQGWDRQCPRCGATLVDGACEHCEVRANVRALRPNTIEHYQAVHPDDAAEEAEDAYQGMAVVHGDDAPGADAFERRYRKKMARRRKRSPLRVQPTPIKGEYPTGDEDHDRRADRAYRRRVAELEMQVLEPLRAVRHYIASLLAGAVDAMATLEDAYHVLDEAQVTRYAAVQSPHGESLDEGAHTVIAPVVPLRRRRGQMARRDYDRARTAAEREIDRMHAILKDDPGSARARAAVDDLQAELVRLSARYEQPEMASRAAFGMGLSAVPGDRARAVPMTRREKRARTMEFTTGRAARAEGVVTGLEPYRALIFDTALALFLDSGDVAEDVLVGSIEDYRRIYGDRVSEDITSLLGDLRTLATRAREELATYVQSYAEPASLDAWAAGRLPAPVWDARVRADESGDYGFSHVFSAYINLDQGHRALSYYILVSSPPELDERGGTSFAQEYDANPGAGYVPCVCPDCMGVAIGRVGDFAYCIECKAAGCTGQDECLAPHAYCMGRLPTVRGEDGRIYCGDCRQAY